MFTKSTIALAVIVAHSSVALAAHKPHHDAANVFGRSQSIDDPCKQKGPIALPPTNPICITKDLMNP